MEPSIRHGSDGWVLEDMTWRESDGRARYVYSRRVPGGEIEKHVRVDEQPYNSTHVGWEQRDRRRDYCQFQFENGKN